MMGFEVLVSPDGTTIIGAMDGSGEAGTTEGMDCVANDEARAQVESDEAMAPSGLDCVAKDEIAAYRAGGSLEIDEANRAPTMEIQARELGEYFRETPELKFENWTEMDIDERLNAVQNLENEAAAIAHRPPMQVRYEQLGEGHLGYQNREGLTINATYLISDRPGDYVETLDTVIHEGRHAYQSENIALAESGKPVIEQNTEWVKAWQVNMLELGYSDPDRFSFDGLGFERYYTQPIEVDARAFAAQAIHEMGLR